MANNGAREEKTVKIDSGYDAHTARAFTPKSFTRDTPTGVTASENNDDTTSTPKPVKGGD